MQAVQQYGSMDGVWATAILADLLVDWVYTGLTLGIQRLGRLGRLGRRDWAYIKGDKRGGRGVEDQVGQRLTTIDIGFGRHCDPQAAELTRRGGTGVEVDSGTELGERNREESLG